MIVVVGFSSFAKAMEDSWGQAGRYVSSLVARKQELFLIYDLQFMIWDADEPRSLSEKTYFGIVDDTCG